MTAVSVLALKVRYDTVEVLKGVDVEIAEGEFFFLLGPSGCGKTTLLRSIAGFVEPSGGDIRFGGRSVLGVPPAKRDCGMVFQNYALWPHLSVFQNVAFGLDVRKLAKEEKRTRVMEALRLVQMEEYADRPPNRLSGGQQQRVALARALVIEPGVLLLDEPLSNLDAKLRVDLRAEIRDIQRRTSRTAVYVTHDRAEALALADRIAVLRDGVIEQLGSPVDLYDRPRSPFVAGFVGDANTLHGSVTGCETDAVTVDGPFGRLVARDPAKSSPAVGSAVQVLLRPERLRLTDQNAETAGDAPAPLAGTVVRRTFLGEVLQYDVQVGGGAIIRVLILGETRGFGEGDLVRIFVDDALCYPAG